MKSFLIILAISISSCASTEYRLKNLTFESLENFDIGKDVESKIVNRLGNPNSKVLENKDDYSFNYSDPDTGHPRVSFYFSKLDNHLISITWFPKNGEKENFLEGAQSHFKDYSFEKVVQKQNSPHLAFPSEANLVDKKNGVSIFYTLHDESVEAIGLFEKQARAPADAKK
jgi:hypothetical protein